MKVGKEDSINLNELDQSEYDNILTKYKSRSELYDDVLIKFLFQEQKWLNISGASFTITDESCHNMVKIIGKDNLQKLQIYNMRNISSESYKMLFNHFTNLVELNIGCARKMNSDSFASLKQFAAMM